MSDNRVAELSAFVVVCEIKDDSVSAYEWRNQLIKLKKSDFEVEDDIELGMMFELIDGRYNLIPDDDDTARNPKVFVREGVVHAKVLAFAPNNSFLSKFDNLEKYRKTAYSYQLQLLDDSNELFFDYPRSEVGLATVKYAPNSKTVFEVVEVEDVPEEYKTMFESLDQQTCLAPWVIEHEQMSLNETSVPREDLPRFHQQTKVPAVAEFFGICVESPVRRGRDSVHNIYCPELGMVRAVDNSDLKLGDWVTFAMNDKPDKKSTWKGRGQDNPVNEQKKLNDHYGRATVTKISMIADQLPTRVGETIYKGVTQISPIFTTTIIFDHEMLETKENAAITDWEERTRGLSKTAHFYCPALGKVEIYPLTSVIILKDIEAHREKLKAEDPSLYEQLKNEKIIIEVDVIPFRMMVSQFRKDPSQALFLVKYVHRIAYLVGGRLIERSQTDN